MAGDVRIWEGAAFCGLLGVGRGALGVEGANGRFCVYVEASWVVSKALGPASGVWWAQDWLEWGPSQKIPGG